MRCTKGLSHLGLLIVRLLLIRKTILPCVSIEAITTIIAAIYRDRKYSSDLSIAKLGFQTAGF